MYKCSGQLKKTFEVRFFHVLPIFRTVAYGVFNFLIAYVFLLVAFAVSFMIIFPQSDAFQILPTAVVKVLNHFANKSREAKNITIKSSKPNLKYTYCMGFGMEVIASDLSALPRTVTHSCRLPRRSRCVDGGASASNLAGWKKGGRGKLMMALP